MRAVRRQSRSTSSLQGEPGTITCKKTGEKREKNGRKTGAEREQNGSVKHVKTGAEREQNEGDIIRTGAERERKACKNGSRTGAEREHIEAKTHSAEKSLKTEQMNDPTLLIGTQKKIFDFVADIAQNTASLKTPPLTLEAISSSINLRTSQTKAAIRHLRKKGLLAILQRKDGRGGWVIYGVPKEAFDTWQKMQNIYYRAQNGRRTGAERERKACPKGGQNASNSSSIFNNTITTREYPNIPVAIPQTLFDIGLNNNHIKQIQSKFDVSDDELSKSLEAYAYDLGKGELNKIRARGISPIKFFFGAMKNGGYNPVMEGFKTSEEWAEIEMATRLEQRQKERKERKGKTRNFAI